MSENATFTIYAFSLLFIGFALLRQTSLLTALTNGTRFTQWTFLISNVSLAMLVISMLLEIKGVTVYMAQETRAVLVLLMAIVWAIFYGKGK